MTPPPAPTAPSLTLVLLAYVVFLYLPIAFYRFWLEQRVSIGRRRDVSQIEDFVQSGLPGIILNAVAFSFVLALWFLKFMAVAVYRGTFSGITQYAPVPWLDRKLIIAVFDHRVLVEHLQNGLSWWTVLYVIVLYGVSAMMGMRYGAQCRLEYVHRRLLYERGGMQVQMRKINPGDKSLRPPVSRNIGVRDLVDGLIWRFGTLFFQESVDELFPYVATKPWVFVRTTDKRLYYGKFGGYEKEASGDVSSITLSDVQRYCYDEIKECLARGDNPVHDFGGPLLIRWSMVADINTVPEDRIRQISQRYKHALEAYRNLSEDERRKLKGVVPYRTEGAQPSVSGGTSAGPSPGPR